MIFGAGGHAKVIIASLDTPSLNTLRIFDDQAQLHGRKILSYEIEGHLPQPDKLPEKDVAGFLAIGRNQIRRKLDLKYTDLQWKTIIHPTAIVHETATVGPGTYIGANCVVQPDVQIGRHCIINTGAIVEHDCVVGDYTHMAPTSCIGGHVKIGHGCLLGIGASVIPELAVGDDSTIGAGSVVVKNIPGPGVTVIGNPARPLEKK